MAGLCLDYGRLLFLLDRSLKYKNWTWTGVVIIRNGTSGRLSATVVAIFGSIWTTKIIVGAAVGRRSWLTFPRRICQCIYESLFA